MARRPAYGAQPPKEIMTRDELKNLERNLSLLSPAIVKERYKQLADRCRFLDLPTPRIIQELVTTWRVLWRWRR
jgi:hypothetical protein